MQDALVAFENNDFKELPKSKDPFFEESSPQLIGSAHYLLQGLTYLLDNPRMVPIMAPNNEVCGKMHMNIVPCDETGNEDLNEEDLPDEPDAILKKRLDFKVKIDKLTDLPEDFCSDVYCEYTFFIDN